ncbi:MAG: sulfatase-like hydrolase/transferase [Planctomycetota bacterium]
MTDALNQDGRTESRRVKQVKDTPVEFQLLHSFVRTSRMGVRNALWLCVASLSSCVAMGEEKQPNILWIVAEDISPLFGCYGNADAVTPNIDAFASRSHVFRRAYATAPICAPSRSCLATGMFATSLGTQNLRSEVPIPPSIQPLAKRLRDAGYWTALRGKTDYNFEPDGLFDHWKQDTTPWQSCPAGKPFYAFMNLGKTHEGSGNLPDRANAALARLPQDQRHDPDMIELPPHFPDTSEMRRIWARYHDLITVFDLEVADVLQQLEDDGESDNTIVFVMADHGMGLPRYKRWLYLTGLHVPLIIHVPERFQHLLDSSDSSSVSDELVSYVDLPATVLRFAGVSIPDQFQGQTLFDDSQREYVFGARDRADDMYDVSRSVFDGRYLYVRHYLPHMIPMQEGIIMSDYRKESHKELYRVHEAGRDTEQSRKLWMPRPYEELYDVQVDPNELNNLANVERLKGVKQRLHDQLKNWIFETRDSGFMPEPEMHRRANGAKLTAFEILQDDTQYPIREILEAAEQASLPNSDDIRLGSHSVVDFWAIQQRIIRGDSDPKTVKLLTTQLSHTNPVVRTAAAEALARIGQSDLAVPTFQKLLQQKEPNLLLYVARSLAISVDNIDALEPDIRHVHEQMLAPPGSPRRWKDFTYSAFTCWALEWALIKAGKNRPEDFGLHSVL